MRDSLFFFLNGSPVRVQGRAAFEMLAPFLRREQDLTGTKVACAQGGCGACTVLLGRHQGDGIEYLPVNSCIMPVFSCDGCHVVTVEGLNGPENLGRGADNGVLSPVQEAMVQCHGAQCGFCTPGIVVSLTAFHERELINEPVDAQRVKTALEGNLCRCTGYSAIVEAGLNVDVANIRRLSEMYPAPPLLDALAANTRESVALELAPTAVQGAQQLFAPRSFEAAVAWKAAHPEAIVVAGATEVGVAMNTEGFEPHAILSLSQVEGLDAVSIETDADGIKQLVMGSRATWTQVEPVAQENVPEFGLLLRRWGSPQLRNAGTVAGNLVRAVSISDSLPFLLACGAHVELVSASGTREVEVEKFLGNGSRRLDLRPDELVRRVIVPLPTKSETLRLYKVAKRRAYDRSVVSAAFLTRVRDGAIDSVRIAYGGVAPRALRLPKTEAWLQGQRVGALDWKAAAGVAQDEISPQSDASASAEYRRQLVSNLLRKWARELRA